MNNKGILAGLLVVVLVIAGVLVFTGGDDAEDNSATTSEEATNEVAQSNIVELAQATESLSTLVDAVVAGDLVDTLSSEGPFTVFAPTNDAFAAALEALDLTAEELLASDDLVDILTYHVVPAEAFAADLSDGQEITTVNGETLTVSIDNGVVKINDATVVSADVDASNGVVHVIDSVLLP